MNDIQEVVKGFQMIYEKMNNECSNIVNMAATKDKILEGPLANPKEKVKVIYSDFAIYKGEIQDGKRYGYGKMTFANLEKFKGQWKDDDMHGEGVYKWPTGSKYVGPFENGKRHGKGGEYRHILGLVYQGDFKDDKFEGFGKAQLEDGSYEGGWEAGLQHGHGTMIFQNHKKFKRYEGEWDSGKMAKKGKFILTNDDIYEGEFTDEGIPNGSGAYLWSEHHLSYSGKWKNGLRDGEGLLLCNEGGEFQYQYQYQGAWKNDKMDGYGRIQFFKADNLVSKFGCFSGVEWKNSKKCHFVGRFTSPEGDYYDGEWLRFRKHEKGTGVDAYGTKIIGRFFDDYPIGVVSIKLRHLKKSREFHRGEEEEEEEKKDEINNNSPQKNLLKENDPNITRLPHENNYRESSRNNYNEILPRHLVYKFDNLAPDGSTYPRKI